MKRIFSLLPVLLIACSVEQRVVPNSPPTVNEPARIFSQEKGTLVPEFFSFFLWPEVSEEEIALKSLTVGQASDEFDKLVTIKAGLGAQNAKLTARFDQLNCTDRFTEPNDDPGDDTVRWLAKPDCSQIVDPNEKASCDQDAKDWSECQSVISQQIQIGDQNRDLSKKIQAQLEIIDKTLDEDPVNAKNKKPVDSKNSKLVFSDGLDGKTQVDITVSGLDEPNSDAPKVKQSSVEGISSIPEARITNVSYDADKRQLKFTIPEVRTKLDSSGKSIVSYIVTGGKYEVTLNRTKDFLNMARLQGELVYKIDGKSRAGRIKIDGKWK